MKPVQQAIIAHLVAKHGWSQDRIKTNWVSKEYDSAVGLKRACLWATFDAVYNQVLMNGEFTSAGENVLAICFSCIREDADTVTLEAAVDAFIAQVEKAIAGSYAVRLLPWRAPSTVPYSSGAMN